MSDPRGPGRPDPTGAGGSYPLNTDPAYSGYWGPTSYGPGYGAPMAQPTEQLSPYWQPGPRYPAPPPPKKSPRWLWAAVAAAVLLITGLVLALVIVSNSSKRSVVEPAPPTASSPLPRPATPTTPRTRIPSAPSSPAPIPIPLPIPFPSEPLEPTEPGAPSEPAPSTATEPVIYNVTGEGRAINITYVDTGGIMQIEFNVALPWSKEVNLAAPARNSASVAVVNVGRDVTCSVSVNGAQIRQRTGRGLTICSGLGG